MHPALILPKSIRFGKNCRRRELSDDEIAQGVGNCVHPGAVDASKALLDQAVNSWIGP